MWVVILQPNERYDYAYGPFTKHDTAKRFAAFLSAEVDPARVVKVADPTEALLHYREHIVPNGDARS